MTKELEPLAKEAIKFKSKELEFLNYMKWGQKSFGKTFFPLEDYPIRIYLERKSPREFGYWATTKGRAELDKFKQTIKGIKPVEPIKPIPKELEPLAVEARKYKSAEEFRQGMWKKINIDKTIIPGFLKGTKEGSIRDANLAISKMLGQTEIKAGKVYATKGWFDTFKDFYTQTTNKGE